MTAEPLSLRAAARSIAEERLSATAVTEACLRHIAASDARIEAWAFLDPDHARRQAAEADRSQRDGRPLGPLHGVPMAIKDVFDTADMPTEYGSPIHAGHQPARDAWPVARLRAAGAVILGKTVTTEFAWYRPGKTRNPHDPARTPGGSSSGSAAAVGAGMVPGALGTQTNGSVIRPAAFCGVVGYKPTHGLIARTGTLMLSRTLDHVGVFARSVEDAALLAETLAGDDADDPDTRPAAHPPLLATALTEPPRRPRLAFVRTAVWDQAEATTRAAFESLAARLAAPAVELPSSFGAALDLHRTVADVEIAHYLAREYAMAPSLLSEHLRTLIERGHATPGPAYLATCAEVAALGRSLDALFEGYDAILTPAAAGEAPLGLAATGSPAFCTLWTLLGVPAISLPLLKGPAGMPLGVQLVGRHGEDARLLRTARWLASVPS
ncbi:MAG: amidase [Alphaproteobacteria bacterium]|nr:amidase [Alphaproteobacteria bacterium]